MSIEPHQHRPQDPEALDALIECGFRPEGIADAAMRARAEHAAAILGLLDLPTEATGADDKRTLVDVTLARIMQSDRRRDRGGVRINYELIPDDEEAVDALVASGLSASKTPGSLRRRAEVAARIGELVRLPVADEEQTSRFRREALIEQTVGKLAAKRTLGEPMRISRGAGSRLRLGDVISLAAMLLLTSAVLWPMGNSVRAQGQRFTCKSGLAGVASALGLYGGDFRDAMPAATAQFAGPWWNVGTPGQSNAANLFTLARTGYTPLDPLACVGNPYAVRGACAPDASDWASLKEVSYSYRILGGPVRVTLTSNPSMIVAVDQSPVVRRAFAGEDVFPLENSANHQGRGQNVLTADGRVTWICTPVTPEGDNIWLSRPIEIGIAQAAEALARQLGRAAPLKGFEYPQSADDQFVGP